MLTKSKPKPKAKTAPSKRPTAVVCNASGVAIVNVEILRPTMAQNLGCQVAIEVGYFDKDKRIAGWRALASYQSRIYSHSGPLTAKLPPFITRELAIMNAAEDLINFLVDRRDTARPDEAKRLKAIIESLSRWQETITVKTKEAAALDARWDKHLKDVHRVPKKSKPGTTLVASCGHHIPPAIIDVPSTAVSADKLSSEERRELKQHEKSIEAGARAWVDMATGLVEIFDRRLYRESHGTFDAWLESKRIDRSIAYGIMKAVRIRRQLQTIKTLPAIELDRESQYRPFPADVDQSDLTAVMRRVAKKVDPDPDGVRRPTAAVVRQAVQEEYTNPRELAQQKKAAEERRKQRPAVELVDQAEREEVVAASSHEPGPGMFGRGAATIASGRLNADEFLEHQEAPFFPRVETMDQACCYIRSWILAIQRQFPIDQLSDLDEELYQQCQVLRKVYQPAIREAAAKKSSGRAK